MAHSQLESVIRYIRTLTARENSTDQSDGELLRAFVRGNDQEAFTELVRRRGPMVFAVSRRVLQNVQDAEDAFQATFLLLAHHAASLLQQESLAGWLHRAAWRIAKNAQRVRVRRQQHERRARTMSIANPGWNAIWPEVQSVLDEEIQRLPVHYRDVFVLCCLENQSGAEAAQNLGIKEGTVKSRLSKARTLLQKSLARRGVSLSAVLAATTLAATTAASTLSRSLVTSTIRAAEVVAAEKSLATREISAVVSDRVIHLIQGASKSMLRSKIKLVLVLTLSLGIGTGGLAVATRQAFTAWPAELAAENPFQELGKNSAPAQDASKSGIEAQKQRASRPVEAEQTKALRGQVLDPDGKPLAGAKLYLAEHSDIGFQFGGSSAPYSDIRHKQVALSGRDGRFRFSLPQKVFAASAAALPWKHSQLIAIAKGYGPDWVSLEAAGNGEEVSFCLVKDVPIQGRILNSDGQPVAGAKVRVNGLGAFTGDGLDRSLENIRKGGYATDTAKNWRGPLPDEPVERMTDKEGRFRIAGLGRERFVQLHLQGPSIQHWYFQVMTRNAEAVQSTPTSYYGGLKVYGAAFEYVAPTARPIRGKVRDKVTGEPLAGVTVSTPEGPTTHSARTDENGSYELLGYPKSATYQLQAQPADGATYFRAMVMAKDTAGLDPLTVNIDLRPGITVRGRVLEGDTAKPVPGARVLYYPLFHRRSVERIPYDTPKGLSSTKTGADGSYCLATLAGPGVLAVECPGAHPYMPARIAPQEVANFFKSKRFDGTVEDLVASGQDKLLGGIVQGQRFSGLELINPEKKSSEDSRRVDIIVERGRTVMGTVVDPDGKPLTGTTINDYPLAGAKLPGTNILKTASFRLTNLNPRSPQRKFFEHKEKGLGLSLLLRGDEPQPLTIRLQPYGTVTGRILDQEGKPVPDVLLRIFPQRETEFLRAKTDQEGRFRIESLPVGETYKVGSPVGFKILVGNGQTASFPPFQVEPGKVKDLGDVKVSK